MWVQDTLDVEVPMPKVGVVFEPAMLKHTVGEAQGRIKMIKIKLSQGAKPGHGGILPQWPRSHPRLSMRTNFRIRLLETATVLPDIRPFPMGTGRMNSW